MKPSDLVHFLGGNFFRPDGSHEKLPLEQKKVRYAVVGLGYIAQSAMLPAFRHAHENSELVALISSDPEKLKKLSDEYGVKYTSDYTGMEECLKNAEVDVIYLSVPTFLHYEFAMRAFKIGVHVLCEKPLASSVAEARAMIDTAQQHKVKLMTAYRLHFESANLEALQIAQSERLGDLKVFNSVFSMQIQDPKNYRLGKEPGAGPLYDLGIYAINAARTLFDSEPTEVVAISNRPKHDSRFKHVDEVISAVLKFPRDRIANITASFGAYSVSSYELIGSKGKLRVDPAYEIAAELRHHLTLRDHTSVRVFKKRDQFAPELLYFSDCILNKMEVEPSGVEGLADLQIIDAIVCSIRMGQKIGLEAIHPLIRPRPDQKRFRPPVSKHELYHAASPSEK